VQFFRICEIVYRKRIFFKSDYTGKLLDFEPEHSLLILLSYMFLKSSAIYSNVIAKNGGYCSDLSKNLSSNSTFVHYNATFYNNAKGYVLVFTNFTAQGFNITDSYYISKKTRHCILLYKCTIQQYKVYSRYLGLQEPNQYKQC